MDIKTKGQSVKKLFKRKNTELREYIDNITLKIGVGSALQVLATILPKTKGKKIQPVYDFLKMIRYYSMDEPVDPTNKLFSEEVISDYNYQSWLSNSQAARHFDDELLMRLLYLSMNHQEKFAELKSLLGRDGLDVINDNSISELKGKDRSLFVFDFQPTKQRDPSSKKLGYSALSQGTRRILRLLACLILDQSSVMLVEHPEDVIHTHLLRKLISLLRTYSEQSQVIFSTHSTTVIDTLRPEEIRLVSMENGETQVRPLNKEEIKQTHWFLEEEGTLSGFVETLENE